VTFPPYTCLEADGEPRVEHTKHGEVVIFPLKVNLFPLHHDNFTGGADLNNQDKLD
jgi:hypothetical protein